MNKKESFTEQCYILLKKVPKGKVTTYKELAHALGTNAYRAVGTAMKKNQNAPKIPCHRVVNSNGLLGGYAFGINKKIQILKKEGIQITQGKIDNFNEVLFKFN